MPPPKPHPNDLRQRLPAGTVLDSVYVIEGEIGSGGFGITYQGRDKALGHMVAVKEYFPVEIGDRDGVLSVHPATQALGRVFTWGREGFVREAQMLAGFRHPNIVRVLRYFEANNTAYMVLEYEDGPSLSRWLARRERGEGGHVQPRRPSQSDLDQITGGLCDALALIHEKRLIHRDIAPDNIIIRADGSPVLLDFGAARYEVADQTRLNGQAVHTTSFAVIKAHYSPFEQRSTDTTRRGPWSDIYALGATLYRAVAGAVPLDAADRIMGDGDQLVSAAELGRGHYRLSFLKAIDRAMAIKPGDRPQTIKAFRDLALAGVRTEPVIGAAPSPQTDAEALGSTKSPAEKQSVSFSRIVDQRARDAAPAPRRPLRMMAAAGALLVGLGAVAWWTATARDDAREAANFAAVAARQASIEARAKAERLASDEQQEAATRLQRAAAERAAAEAEKAAEEAQRARLASDEARREQIEAERQRALEETRQARERELEAQAALERERAARAAADARALQEREARAAQERNETQARERLATATASPAPVPAEVQPAGTNTHIEKRANWSTKGEGYATMVGSSYADCEARCLGDTTCQAMEFFKPKRQCNLYANVPLDGPSNDADVGIKRQGVAPAAVQAGAKAVKTPAATGGRVVRQRNRFFVGDGYRKVSGSSFHACERLCLDDSTCRALELHRKGNVCQLYGSVPKTGVTNDADVGVKQ